MYVLSQFHNTSSTYLPLPQEELTVKKGDAMAFCGVLGFGMLAFYAVQQVPPVPVGGWRWEAKRTA